MATVKISSLKCGVTTFRDEKTNKIVTKFIVTIGGTNLIVATGTLPGKWDEQWALYEFKKNPGRFQTLPQNLSVAKAAGLLAA